MIPGTLSMKDIFRIRHRDFEIARLKFYLYVTIQMMNAVIKRINGLYVGQCKKRGGNSFGK